MQVHVKHSVDSVGRKTDYRSERNGGTLAVEEISGEVWGEENTGVETRWERGLVCTGETDRGERSVVVVGVGSLVQMLLAWTGVPSTSEEAGNLQVSFYHKKLSLAKLEFVLLDYLHSPMLCVPA